VIPKVFISRDDLRFFNGEDKDRIYVAYKGTVYDVSDCPRWHRGLHEGVHFPGQDLTKELDNDAPHTGGVFSHPCVKVVGHLTDD
jgi:predicted heme/steroid binding protein